MNISMITVNRGVNNYIEQTVASLLASDWLASFPAAVLTIFVGSDDETHLQNLLGHQRVRVIHFEPDINADCTSEQMDWLQFRKTQTRAGDMRRNCGVNKATALGFGPALFCEDDVRFDPAWCAKLAEIVSAMSATPDFVLDLAKGTALAREAQLVGSQAVYFSVPATQARIALALRQRYQNNGPAICSDVFVGQRANEFSELWHKRLVTHVGAHSTFAAAGR